MGSSGGLGPSTPLHPENHLRTGSNALSRRRNASMPSSRAFDPIKLSANSSISTHRRQQLHRAAVGHHSTSLNRFLGPAGGSRFEAMHSSKTPHHISRMYLVGSRPAQWAGTTHITTTRQSKALRPTSHAGGPHAASFPHAAAAASPGPVMSSPSTEINWEAISSFPLAKGDAVIQAGPGVVMALQQPAYR